MHESPTMRISPRREMRPEKHKRGRSLESGILHRKKEDDLALFNEVQNKEQDNFLLQSNDNFDDIFSIKSRFFSDYKLGISVRAQGESSDLLNGDGDKNDYDWLITPPETPLFRSLDDETREVNVEPRGRPRSQPVPNSQSPTMENGYRSGRRSASPKCLSPSPRSGSSTLQSRSRPFSTNHSSPPHTLSNPSPSRRQSPPALRSNSPTPRRMSGSPVKTSRGNSASPKTRAWESSIAEFSSEAPPNLRTSLNNRPASRNGRQSMSPTASRSVRSLSGHERDPFSFNGKSSFASCGDDDVSSSDRSAPRSIGAYPSYTNTAMSFSKKPAKSLSSSAPKRSLDLVRQMDRKGPPQNMFRPLLSSVPSSTFYAGKASGNHQSRTSMNSSITTSSNASSDQATGGAHGTEESEQNREDMTSDCVKGLYPDVDDEVFDMELADALVGDVENRIVEDSLSDGHGEIDGVYADGAPDMAICSECGLVFHSPEVLMEGYLQLCLECKGLEVNSIITSPLKIEMVGEKNTQDFVQSPEHGSLQATTSADEAGVDRLDNLASLSQHAHGDSGHNLTDMPIEERAFSTQQVVKPLTNGDSECAGISLLLTRSNSVKGRTVQSRSFTASNTSYDDFSYVRGSVNSMRSSIDHSSTSLSSSVDLGYSRQKEIQIHRQSSGHKSDLENYRYEMPAKHKRSVSSMSDASARTLQVPVITHGDSFQVITANVDKEFGEEISLDPREQSLASECTEAESSSTSTASELSGPLMNVCTEDNSVLSDLMPQDPASDHIQAEEDAIPSSCVDTVEIAEVPKTSSLGAISEIETENAGVVSANFHSDELEHNEAKTGTREEFGTSHLAHGVIEESRVLIEDTGETKPRSLTLEEATDAILFCNSIVHNLAYEAANIAIHNEILPIEVLRPIVKPVGKSDSEKRDNTRSRTVRKRNSKSQKAPTENRVQMDTKHPCNNGETDENSNPGIVRDPNNADSLIPPKLESKCNCIIM
ncbi:hypothetical protein ABFS82_05G023500 [Erythranthe guttata]|uniref:uncharacterized protein LOC105974732 n=1 Tax=Erythranthe guttata TaxID=4155 RepID=UPI00064E0DB0|nr:PREDICTED: uncharacterized protein LOC105974732 [Erythranthe guttata]|eukprot:XP_012855329.1 PREDICTED: uncharacterized protein LOC105974732 [Erythranthe guttata]